MLSRGDVGTYQESKLTRNLSENSCPQSSQLAEPLWIYIGLKSGIVWCVRADLHLKQKNKMQVGNDSLTLLPKSLLVRKKPPP